MSHTKALAIAQRPAAKATDAQLAQINTYTLREFGAEELVVREYALAHNCIDRDRECFDEALLQDFARTLPGKGVFIRHPSGWDGDSGPGEGRVFAASLQSMSLEEARTMLREPTLTLPPDRSLVTVLMASAFFVRTGENEALLTKMDAGIASDVSIGFNASDRNRVQGSDGIELNAWRWSGPGEALEMSMVWLGAQPGARAIKASKPHTPEEPAMSDTKDTASVDALKAAQPKAAQFDAIKSALGADAALADDATQLAALALAGKAYRSSLVDQVIKADRLSGLVGDTDADVAGARKEYDALPLRTLKFMADKAATSTAGSDEPRLQGGDPNTARTTADKSASTDNAPALIAGAL